MIFLGLGTLPMVKVLGSWNVSVIGHPNFYFPCLHNDLFIRKQVDSIPSIIGVPGNLLGIGRLFLLSHARNRAPRQYRFHMESRSSGTSVVLALNLESQSTILSQDFIKKIEVELELFTLET